ncbi:family 43 glycosylhydrolase, partial [Streptomyces sp. NPDC002851]
MRRRLGSPSRTLLTYLAALAALCATLLTAPPGTVATATAAERQEPYAGYLFAYFTGEGTADGEQIRYALSRGNDPLHWRELNGGKPVLTSDVGEKGLRDPFVIRSPQGDKFYMIATDLRMYRN